MSTTQFNPDADPMESFIQHFEAADMKGRLQAMRLILAEHPVKPGPLPPRPDIMSPEQHARFLRAIRGAQDWERAHVKGLIRQARRQARETQKA